MTVAERGDAAEFDGCRAARLVGCHAAANVFLDEQRQMRLRLPLEVIIQRSRREERANAREEAAEGGAADVGCLDESPGQSRQRSCVMSRGALRRAPRADLRG